MTTHTNPSQSRKILRWLQHGRSITPLQALNRFGCFRLGARIWELRREGVAITKTTVKRGGKQFASYRLA